MRLIQVTLGAAATRVTTGQIYSPAVIIQNNAAANVRVGDNTVSATKGLLLLTASGGGGGSITIYRADNRIPLFEYFLFGTAGNIIDVFYE
jgi:hypothetical protein